MSDAEYEAYEAGLREMIDWMTFLRGWLDGYRAASGDTAADDLTQRAHAAYQEFVAEQSARLAR